MTWVTWAFQFVLPLFLHVLFLSVFCYCSFFSPCHHVSCSNPPCFFLPSSSFSPLLNDNSPINNWAEKSFLTNKSGSDFSPSSPLSLSLHVSFVSVCAVQYFSVYIYKVCNRSSASKHSVYITAMSEEKWVCVGSVCLPLHHILWAERHHMRLGFLSPCLTCVCVCTHVWIFVSRHKGDPHGPWWCCLCDGRLRNEACCCIAQLKMERNVNKEKQQPTRWMQTQRICQTSSVLPLSTFSLSKEEAERDTQWGIHIMREHHTFFHFCYFCSTRWSDTLTGSRAGRGRTSAGG